MRIKVVTCANEPFLPLLDGWLVSIRKNWPEAEPHIRLVNCPNVDLGCETTVIRRKFPIFKQEKFYCAHIKPKMMRMVAEEGDGYVFWLDADSLVINPAKPLMDFIQKCDFGLIKKKSGRATASCMSAKCVPEVVSFLRQYEKWTKACEKTKTPWVADQEALNWIIPKWKDRIKIAHIPRKLCYWQYIRGSVIYNAKGGSGRRARAFKHLTRKILK